MAKKIVFWIFFIIFICSSLTTVKASHLMLVSSCDTQNGTYNVDVILSNYTGKLALSSFWIEYNASSMRLLNYRETLSNYTYLLIKDDSDSGLIKFVIYNVNPQTLSDPVLISMEFGIIGNVRDISSDTVKILKVEELRNFDGRGISVENIRIENENVAAVGSKNGSSTAIVNVPPSMNSTLKQEYKKDDGPKENFEENTSDVRLTKGQITPNAPVFGHRNQGDSKTFNEFVDDSPDNVGDSNSPVSLNESKITLIRTKYTPNSDKAFKLGYNWIYVSVLGIYLAIYLRQTRRENKK